MRTAYRLLAYILAVEVMVQAAAIAFAVFGLTKWVDDGGTLDKAAMESDDTTFTGAVGFMIHGINGTTLIPLFALLLLIVSFFAKVPGGVGLAGFVLVAVVAQVLLGIFAHSVPALGALHGIVALLILGASAAAGRRAGDTHDVARRDETALV